MNEGPGETEELEAGEGLSYDDHPFGEHFRRAYGGNPLPSNELVVKIDAVHEEVQRNLAEARQWLRDHQLYGPEIEKVLKDYEEDWDLTVNLLHNGIYISPATTTCVLYHRTGRMRLAEERSRESGIEIPQIGKYSPLAFWCNLDESAGELDHKAFLEYYERMHSVLYGAIKAINLIDGESKGQLYKFAFTFNNLMLLLKLDMNDGTLLDCNRFKPFARNAVNVYNRDFPKQDIGPIRIHICEEFVLFMIIEGC